MSQPTVAEARQLCRLRELRVQRAQAKRNEAQTELERAIAAVAARKRVIQGIRGEIVRLAHAVVNELAPDMPRWATLVAAERARLDDRLERECYALESEDEPAVEAARTALAQAQVALARERSREDVVKDLAREAFTVVARAREQRAEAELEDRFIKAAA